MNGSGVQRPSLLVHAATHTHFSSLFTPTLGKIRLAVFQEIGFNVNILYKALFESVVATMNSLFCSSRKYIADVFVQTVYCFPVTLTHIVPIHELSLD